MYLLPKIHKDPASWTIPYEIPTGRPIISDCGSETYGTAEFIEYHLNPLSIRHKSYIKDSYQFVEIIKNIVIPMNAILFSIDIDSLYTNIDTNAGLQAIKDILRKYPDRRRPDKELGKKNEQKIISNLMAGRSSRSVEQ